MTETTDSQSTDAGQTETFDVSIEIAEVYESRFVPALFAEWAPVTLEAGSVSSTDRLLDVACGTGIVARTARQRFGPATEITGVDLNPAMLTVAGRKAPDIDFQLGDVAALPFDDDRFDVAVSQMAAMFFPDLRAALAEMGRVTRPGGRLALVVPSALDEQPAYGPFVEVAVAVTDDEARSLLGAYWACGDRDALAADVAAAGLQLTGSRARAGTARFESVADFVATEIDATPLAERINASDRAKIVDGVAERLADHVRPGQPFEIPLVGNVISAQVPTA